MAAQRIRFSVSDRFTSTYGNTAINAREGGEGVKLGAIQLWTGGIILEEGSELGGTPIEADTGGTV